MAPTGHHLRCHATGCCRCQLSSQRYSSLLQFSTASLQHYLLWGPLQQLGPAGIGAAPLRRRHIDWEPCPGRQSALPRCLYLFKDCNCVYWWAECGVECNHSAERSHSGIHSEWKLILQYTLLDSHSLHLYSIHFSVDFRGGAMGALAPPTPKP